MIARHRDSESHIEESTNRRSFDQRLSIGDRGPQGLTESCQHTFVEERVRLDLFHVFVLRKNASVTTATSQQTAKRVDRPRRELRTHFAILHGCFSPQSASLCETVSACPFDRTIVSELWTRQTHKTISLANMVVWQSLSTLSTPLAAIFKHESGVLEVREAVGLSRCRKLGHIRTTSRFVPDRFERRRVVDEREEPFRDSRELQQVFRVQMDAHCTLPPR